MSTVMGFSVYLSPFCCWANMVFDVVVQCIVLYLPWPLLPGYSALR
jgi:hypothetical protein